MTGAWISLCVGAHGWVAGIVNHGSVLLSSSSLITLEAPGHPGHPSSTQLNAVVNYYYCITISFLVLALVMEKDPHKNRYKFC